MIFDLKEFTHLPSAVSHAKYIDYIFTNDLIKPYVNKIIIGKPFGTLAYFNTWYKKGYIDKILPINILKTDSYDFIDFSDEILGNALGIGAGFAIAQNDKVWVNISDACLQCGPTIEAIQFIGRNKLNIVVTIDYNEWQLTSKILDNINGYYEMFKNFGWSTFILDESDLSKLDEYFKSNGPICCFIKTDKSLNNKIDPVKNHYISDDSTKKIVIEYFKEINNEKN